MKKRHVNDRHTDKYWAFVNRRGLNKTETNVFEQLVDCQISNGGDWFHKKKDEIAEKLMMRTDELDKVVLDLGKWHGEYIKVEKKSKKIRVDIKNCVDYLPKPKPLGDRSF